MEGAAGAARWIGGSESLRGWGAQVVRAAEFAASARSGFRVGRAENVGAAAEFFAGEGLVVPVCGCAGAGGASFGNLATGFCFAGTRSGGFSGISSGLFGNSSGLSGISSGFSVALFAEFAY